VVIVVAQIERRKLKDEWFDRETNRLWGSCRFTVGQSFWPTRNKNSFTTKGWPLLAGDLETLTSLQELQSMNVVWNRFWEEVPRVQVIFSRPDIGQTIW
jgi:hypothetical protein